MKKIKSLILTLTLIITSLTSCNDGDGPNSDKIIYTGLEANFCDSLATKFAHYDSLYTNGPAFLKNIRDTMTSWGEGHPGYDSLQGVYSYWNALYEAAPPYLDSMKNQLRECQNQ